MDRGTVIYDIERCTCHVPDACRDCSHYTGTIGYECMEGLMRDALDLLREQEPVEAVDNPEGPWFALCGECGHSLGFREIFKYCPHCGKEVKWNE